MARINIIQLKMIKIKQLAVFMDDANALFMELYNHMIVSRNIVFKSKENEEYIQYNYSMPLFGSDKDHRQLAYYNEISSIIRNYQQVVLFGPTETKNEVYEHLKADKHFDKIKIDIVYTKEMTDFQIHEFVLDYYK
jgi:stalled ribosome rescue protein Dom34